MHNYITSRLNGSNVFLFLVSLLTQHTFKIVFNPYTSCLLVLLLVLISNCVFTIIFKALHGLATDYQKCFYFINKKDLSYPLVPSFSLSHRAEQKHLSMLLSTTMLKTVEQPASGSERI